MYFAKLSHTLAPTTTILAITPADASSCSYRLIFKGVGAMAATIKFHSAMALRVISGSVWCSSLARTEWGGRITSTEN